MGYGNKYRRKFRRFRRRRNNFSSSKFIRRIVKKSIVRNSETKFKITNINQNLSNSVGYEKVYGNDITIGTGNDQRIGNQIMIMRVGFDLTAFYARGTSSIPQGSKGRVMLAMPRKGLSSSDLITYFSNTNPGVDGRLDPDQGIALYDKKFLLTALNGGGNGIPFMRFRYYKYLRLMKSNYDDANATLDNMPVLYLVCDADAVNNSYVNFAGTVSTTYKDL